MRIQMSKQVPCMNDVLFLIQLQEHDYHLAIDIVHTYKKRSVRVISSLFQFDFVFAINSSHRLFMSIEYLFNC